MMSIPYSMVAVYQAIMAAKSKPHYCVGPQDMARATGLREGNCAGILRRLEDLDVLEGLRLSGGKYYVWTGRNKRFVDGLEEAAKVYKDINTPAAKRTGPVPMF